MVILRGFAGCAGLIPSRPKHEECRHLIGVHNELPRCEDRRLIDAKFGLVMNVEGGKYRQHRQHRLRPYWAPAGVGASQVDSCRRKRDMPDLRAVVLSRLRIHYR